MSNTTNYNNSINNLQTLYNAYTLDPDAKESDYADAAQDYVNHHYDEVDANYKQSDLQAAASLYALKKIFGDSINIYRANTTDTEVTPMTASGDATFNVQAVDCPN